MMKKSLHHLRVLKAVKSQGSVTQAAQMLHITQPAVSNILKQLESSYGYPVVETIGKRIYLTKAGERLIQAATDIEYVLTETQTDLDNMHNKLSGQLSVTIVSTAKYFVPKLLGAFRRLHPEVTIKLQVCNRDEAIASLKRNENDFLIMSQPPESVPIALNLFYQDELVVAASNNAELPKKQLSLADMGNMEWIIREQGSGTRLVMKGLFKKSGISPKITLEVGNTESIKQLIIADMGISVVSRQSIELELDHNLLQILPVKEFPVQHAWYMVTPKGKTHSPIMKQFCDFADGNIDLIHYQVKAR